MSVSAELALVRHASNYAAGWDSDTWLASPDPHRNSLRPSTDSRIRYERQAGDVYFGQVWNFAPLFSRHATMKTPSPSVERGAEAVHIDRVGPYDLVERLGVGGMAETFIAIRRGPGGFEQRVCIKRILEDRANDPSFVGPFLDEARLIARMRCANIVQVHDFGECRGTYYMALELVEGTDLDGLLRDARASHERLPVDACLYVAAALLSALAYAHELSADGLPLTIIHRDISPSNLLLSAHGEVKLTDFGIAKARGRIHKTMTGLIKGKLPYMSPEQVRAEALTQSTDLFSTGVLLYEMLAGEHPFDNAADAAIVRKIMTAEHRHLGAVAPHLPAEVCELIESLLELSPENRPASARLALAQLSSHVKFVAGQQLLAERVASCLDRRARHKAHHASLQEDRHGERPRVRERVDPLELDDTDQQFARTAKNTTARPPRMPVRRAALPFWVVLLGAGLSALVIATGVWVSYGAPIWTTSAVLPTLPSPPAPVVQTSEQRAGASLPLPLPLELPAPAPWPAPEAEPLSSPPGARALPSALTEQKQARPVPRDARPIKKRGLREAHTHARSDAGRLRGHRAEMTPDQF